MNARISWQKVLVLAEDRSTKEGSVERLNDAIRRGADLRIATNFRYNDHIDVASSDSEIIHEVSDFRVTYLIENSWSAGIMNLRYPVAASRTFGPEPSASFFLYNQDGTQGIARPYFDGRARSAAPGPSPIQIPPGMAKYEGLESWDQGTNAPSSSFIYHFEDYAFWVRDEWQEVFAHDESGRPLTGSFDALVDAFRRGAEMKVGISGLCRDLEQNGSRSAEHEVFVHCGSGYQHTKKKLFFAGTQPVVRVNPKIPLAYSSKSWDFGPLLVQTDGWVDGMICDPYSLKFSSKAWRCPLRWFVR